MKILFLTSPKKNSITTKIKGILVRAGHEVHTTHDSPDVINFQYFDLGISYNYRHIIGVWQLQAVKHGIMNIHISYLPFNKGSYPNAFTILNGAPGGVTIHWMDEGIDTGDILAQSQLNPESWWTSEEYYWRLQGLAGNLFKSYWPLVEEHYENHKKFPPGAKQGFSFSKANRRVDYDNARDIVSYLGEEGIEPKHIMRVLDVLRACTFPGFEGAYIYDKDDNKIAFQLVATRIEEDHDEDNS